MVRTSESPTIGQRRLLQYIEEHHPNEWVNVRGRNCMSGKGLSRRGYLDLRVHFGLAQVRLNNKGREFLASLPSTVNDYTGGLLHQLY